MDLRFCEFRLKSMAYAGMVEFTVLEFTVNLALSSVITLMTDVERSV